MTSPGAQRPFYAGGLASELKLAAAAVVAEEGVKAVTMAKVSKRAGVSSGAPYHHFATVDELLRATAVDAYDSFRQRQLETIAGIADPREALRARIDVFFGLADHDPAGFQLVFFSGYTLTSEPLVELARLDFELTLQLVAQIVGAPESECRELALGVSAVVLGYATSMKLYSPVSSISEVPTLTHRAVTMLLAGFQSSVDG